MKSMIKKMKEKMPAKSVMLLGLLVIFASLLFLAGCTSTTTDTMMEKSDSMMKDDSDMVEDTGVMVAKDDMMDESDAMMEKEDSMMMSYKGDVLAGENTVFLDFNKEDYEAALNEGKTVFLYFYANWCPTCKAELVDTYSAFNKLETKNVIGFRVNYKDSDTDSYEESLAKKYSITYQHTKVLIKDDEVVFKAPDSWKEQRYLDELSIY